MFHLSLSMLNMSPEQETKLEEWQQQQDAKVLEQQRVNDPTQDMPYYGCSGGEYSYIFTPTSLGIVLEVRNNVTKEQINLIDYKE